MKKKCFFLFAIIISMALVGLLNSKNTSAVTITYCSGSKDKESPEPYTDPVIIDGDCSSNPSKLKKYLLDSGYNENAAAGIMGNIRGESRYRPNVIQGGKTVDENFRAFTNGVRSSLLKNSKGHNLGFGLAQWTTSGRLKNLQNHADEISKPVATMDAQASFLVKELSNYKLSPSTLNNMSMEEVTWVILRDYETPLSVFCTSSSSSGCKNEASARNVSLSTLISNKNRYLSAYASYSARLNYSKGAYSLDISDCEGGGDKQGEEPYDPTDPPSGDDPADDTKEDPPASGGALGKQSSSGFYAQCKANYSNDPWRKDNSNICTSGCSLVAVANSAKYLNATPNNPGDLASWSRSIISGPSGTGWLGSVKTLMNYLNLKWENNGGYLWSTYSTPTSTKLAEIRRVLASGGVVIAGGDREKSGNPNRQSVNCNSSANVNAGLCVFSKNGHFVTIIGMTSDGRLIIANSANGTNGTATNDGLNPENVLKFSNKAIGVYK